MFCIFGNVVSAALVAACAQAAWACTAVFAPNTRLNTADNH